MYKTFLNRMIHTSVSRLIPRVGKDKNPGTAHQLRAVESTEEITHDFSDMESDFMDVHKTHKQHELETQMMRERTRLAVVKQKYFKQKSPNFLMFGEKELIKLLHQRDSEEWSVEKLAESFPASFDVIKKIVRANWKPYSKDRVRQHDISVLKNWKFLQEGHFATLPSGYKEHLNKFCNRLGTNLFKNKFKGDESFQSISELPKPKCQEFVSIVTTCEKFQNNPTQKALPLLKVDQKVYHEQKAPTINREDDTYLIDKIQDKRIMRLRELNKLKINPFSNQPSEHSSNSNNNHEISETVIGTKSFNTDSNWIEKLQSSEITIGDDDRKRYEMSGFKNNIYIPKKLWRKNATYKVDDYYYDHDGDFLYRVPGMTGKKDKLG